MSLDTNTRVSYDDTAPIGTAGMLDSDLNDDADSDSKLSPMRSPRAASPYHPASCPVDVPRSNGNSTNGSTSAQAAQHAGAEVSTPSRPVLQDRSSMPPLSPPDPDLHPEVLEQLLQKASPAVTDNRFSMADFMRNKAAMTAAARRELAGGADHTLHRPAVEDNDITTSLEGMHRVLLRMPLAAAECFAVAVDSLRAYNMPPPALCLQPSADGTHVLRTCA